MRRFLPLVLALALTACGGKTDPAKDNAGLDTAKLEELAKSGDEAAKAELEKRQKAEWKAAFEAAKDDAAKDKLASEGNPWAQHWRGIKLLESTSTAEQQAGFLDLEAASDAGQPDAQLWVGEKMAYGLAGYPWKPNSGLKLMEKAALQGHVEAMFILAKFYEAEQPMQDIAKAREWYKKAADLGHAEAKTALEVLGPAPATPN